MKTLLFAVLTIVGLAPTQGAPPAFLLDEVGGIGGVTFGKSAASIIDFKQRFQKKGKPRLSTQLYIRSGDTTQISGVVSPTFYWFRQGKFIGIDQEFHSLAPAEQALVELTKRYGAAQVDVRTRQWYWLGQHSFILLEISRNRTGELLMGSLAMLNELVEEVPVRAQARQLLGWQPDSMGLPKQLRLRH